MDMALFIHILGGGLGLVSGYIALFAAKGARLHRQSGMLFVYAMLTMSLTGAVVAALRATEGSVIAGLLTAYMVVTALTTVRPAVAGLRWLNIALMALALTVGVTSIAWGVQALAKPEGMEDEIPAGGFLFGAVALLAGLSDIRVIRSGALQGRQRLVRHPWRMGYALWIAAASFFLGQADEFPKALRNPGLLALPVLVVIVTTLYWLWRVRIRRPEPLHSKENKMQLTAHSMRTLLLCLLAPAAVAMAQDNPPPAAAAAPSVNPLSDFNKVVWKGLKPALVRSAEKMPEEKYGFKPTDTVRSYGQIIGHIADSQYTFCSRALGEKRPELKVEETKTTRGDLIAALNDALAYCDKAFDSMTDASAVQTVKFFGKDSPKLGVLNVHLMHSMEHYGNLVTYMRMNGIVPPSSEPGFRPAG